MSKFGKIKTVCCKNFVTYSKCVFHPTEYLNVIIGPNGTGKSTLVSAIVLSLGGEPILLARSNCIGDYVQNGYESATVSVEIYDGNEEVDCKTTIFQRWFNKDNKSNFYVNNQPVSKKNFLEAVSKYNIQISNLCQFLPQDRVQDFAKIEPPDILQNTINSVCESEEINNFKILKQLKNEQNSGLSNHKQLVQKLGETEQRVEELKIQLERYNARREIEEKLNVCNAKKLMFEIKEQNKQILECDEDIKMAKTSFTKYNTEYKSIINKKNTIDTTTEHIKQEIEQKDLLLKTAEEKKSEIIRKIELLKKKIYEEKSNFKKCKCEFNERLNELKHETKMLQVYAQDIKNLEDNKVSDFKCKEETEKKLNEYKSEIKRLNNDLRNINNKLDESFPEIQNLKERLKNLENETEQKLQFIKSRFSDVYKSIIWLEKNMNLFQGRVYKPMIIELKVRNPNSAKYLENIIPIRDLLAFSCENPSDLSVLVTELCTKQKLMVNVFHASQPDQSIFIPRVKIDDIRKYGFESYLIDQVSGPPAILGYLCSVYNLQNIPFGDNKVNNFTDQIPKNIRCYFGGHLHYTLTFSKYGNRAQSLMQSYIKGKGFLSSKDENEINIIKSRLSEIIPKNDKLRNHRTAIEAEIRKYEILYKEQSQVLKELAGRASELEQKINQLKRQKQKISLLQQDLVGIPEMEKKLKETGLKLLKDIIQLEHSKVGAFGIFQKAIANKTCSKTKLFIFKQENEELNNVIQTAKEKLDSAQKRIDIISNKCNSLKRDSKLKLAEARSLLNNCDPDDIKFPYRVFYSTLPDNITELKDCIHDFSGRLDCMDNLDSEIVREYDEKKKEVEHLKGQIQNNELGDKNYVKEIKAVYNKWYPKIFEIISTINSHFSDFMQSMGYVGEVKLIRKEEFDFDSYGIEILVQYRKNVALQPLSRNVQSGGERAVAIAVYTLSMQHITHVPFRCVDEINQGMDARNERKIFEMLVDETTKTGRAQYFFVTPKLLRNLKTHERMSVHVVYNGRMVQSQNAFAFQI